VGPSDIMGGTKSGLVVGRSLFLGFLERYTWKYFDNPNAKSKDGKWGKFKSARGDSPL